MKKCIYISNFLIVFIFRAEERRRGKRLGVVLINDLQGLSLELVTSVKAIKIYFLVIQAVQVNTNTVSLALQSKLTKFW